VAFCNLNNTATMRSTKNLGISFPVFHRIPNAYVHTLVRMCVRTTSHWVELIPQDYVAGRWHIQRSHATHMIIFVAIYIQISIYLSECTKIDTDWQSWREEGSLKIENGRASPIRLRRNAASHRHTFQATVALCIRPSLPSEQVFIM
jgi:hypothetical protein